MLLLALLAIVASLPAPPAASACSCLVASAAAARRSASMVFEGTALRITPSSDGRAHAVFRVSRVWKGSVTREITIDVPAQPSMCPPHLQQGEVYILYVDVSDGESRVRACARYAGASQLDAERRELGAPIRRFPS